MLKKNFWLSLALLVSLHSKAEEFLVKTQNLDGLKKSLSSMKGIGESAEIVDLKFEGWTLVKGKNVDAKSMTFIEKSAGVEEVQPNYKITLPEDYRLADKALVQKLLLLEAQGKMDKANPPADNPPLPTSTIERDTGADPLLAQQWGMQDIGTQKAWNIHRGDDKIVVAVLDTGIDYTHPDLIPNLWMNPGETGKDAQGRDKATNGIDDDGNGYVDDVIGWDFASNDRFPYDLSLSLMDILLKGGNPGHGTHCAGNVAARGLNGKGISGVAPRVKLMGLRFITEKGQGTTADAIRAIKYAVDNGARVLSNSWGSEGEDPNEQSENTALRNVIQYAQDKGALFIAAAGNGHQGKGYDNDIDAKPAYPASYPHENIISVAAIDSSNKLGAFSNWGKESVDLAAPGVKVFSTVPGNKYADTIVDLFGTKVTWDGTSMATPHVAGAAALYWSQHPEKNWREVKESLMNSTAPVAALQGKTVTGGKLNLERLIRR